MGPFPFIKKLAFGPIGNFFQAHQEGIYAFDDGAYIKVKELPQEAMILLERAFTTAQAIFLHLCGQKCRRSADPVFDSIMDMSTEVLSTPVENANFNVKKWAGAVGKALPEISKHFKKKKSDILDLYGLWFQTPKPPRNSSISFKDMCVRICPDSDGVMRMERLDKSKDHDCYFQLPMNLKYKVSDKCLLKLRDILATIFSSRPQARRANLAMEALVFMGARLPRVIIVLQGPGVDGKSVYSLLRKNVHRLNSQLDADAVE